MPSSCACRCHETTVAAAGDCDCDGRRGHDPDRDRIRARRCHGVPMSYSERQRRLLGAMGLRVWQPAVRAAPRPAAASVAPVPQAAPSDSSLPPAARSGASLPQPAPSGALLPQPAPSAEALPAFPTSADWPALRTAIAACQACDLSRTRGQPVLGAAAVRADWMIVGDAPGQLEDQAGEPFLGPAGQLLDRMLAALQLSRAGAEAADPARLAYVTSPLKCSPPPSRSAGAEALARCAPFLQQQIALVQPRVLLAMGPFAVKALLKSEQPVGRLRGQVHRCHGVPLVVTYHPGYLLRNPHDKARAWEDLCLAAQTAAH